MKRVILFAILVVSFSIAGYTFYTAWRLQDPEFQRERTLGALRMMDIEDSERRFVSLDDMAALRPAKEGTREILPMHGVSFMAAVKEAPQEISTSYLQEAMGVMGVDPLPKITHRMFVETEGGLVMPVYVWDNVAPAFSASEEPQTMVGFHVYTYAKGPAIVVDGVI